MKKVVKTKLAKLNDTYCNYNQSESDDQRFMVRNNHPRAKSYKRLRAFFDKLKFCCNSSARLFSYIDEDNESQIWAPKLNISWRAGFVDSKGIKVHEVYPAMGGIYYDYLKSLAERGWKDCDADLDVGSVHIHTSDPEFKNELDNLPLNAHVSQYGNSTHYTYYGTSGLTVSEFYKLVKLIRKHHKRHVLPNRSIEQSDNENRILPMERKTVMMGNSDDVQVQERTVLVPQIPLNSEQQSVMHKIAAGLTKCLHQGLPWEQAERHLKGFLTKKAFERLQNQFS
tara:strand:+ start:24704 stop:25552 length:849 start_codon:yes stop_codon:yes gene_type:complete